MNDLEKIELHHFEAAITKIKSTLSRDIVEKYEAIAKKITESKNIKEPSADIYK